MKFQILFSGKNKKNISNLYISKCCQLKFLPSMLSVNQKLVILFLIPQSNQMVSAPGFGLQGPGFKSL